LPERREGTSLLAERPHENFSKMLFTISTGTPP
jgi:hypothetical protein